MSGARVFSVAVGDATYSVRAEVLGEDRETGTPASAWISSVTRDGVEIADEEFEPIAGQLEAAVIDAHYARLEAARSAA